MGSVACAREVEGLAVERTPSIVLPRPEVDGPPNCSDTAPAAVPKATANGPSPKSSRRIVLSSASVGIARLRTHGMARGCPRARSPCARPQDARPADGGVDRDVVHRPSAGLAEVPRRIDGKTAGRCSRSGSSVRGTSRTRRRRSPTRRLRSLRTDELRACGHLGRRTSPGEATSRRSRSRASAISSSASATVVDSVLFTCTWRPPRVQAQGLEVQADRGRDRDCIDVAATRASRRRS